jgi:hypothetical protein
MRFKLRRVGVIYIYMHTMYIHKYISMSTKTYTLIYIIIIKNKCSGIQNRVSYSPLSNLELNICLHIHIYLHVCIYITYIHIYLHTKTNVYKWIIRSPESLAPKNGSYPDNSVYATTPIDDDDVYLQRLQQQV